MNSVMKKKLAAPVKKMAAPVKKLSAPVKKLSTPVRKIKCCVTGGKVRTLWSKYRGNRGKGVRSRGRGQRSTGRQEPSIRLPYQDDLEKERKQREAKNAQKNAHRAAMRAHFRRKYQLSKNAKDSNRVRTKEGKMRLPRVLAAMVQPEAPAKEDPYSLLSAFQDLSFNMGMRSGRKHTKTPVSTDCNVM